MFAEKANVVGPWIERQMDSVASIGMGISGALEDQLIKLKTTEQSVIQYRSHVDELEKIHQVMPSSSAALHLVLCLKLRMVFLHLDFIRKVNVNFFVFRMSKKV